MAGVLASLCLFLCIAIQCARLGGFGLIWSLAFAAIAGAIFKGVEFGYTAARFVFGLLAVMSIGGIINPFAYDDAQAARIPYARMVCGALAAATLFLFLFHCLGEHKKLRNLRTESWFPWVSTLVLFYVIAGVLLLSLIGLAPAMSAHR